MSCVIFMYLTFSLDSILNKHHTLTYKVTHFKVAEEEEEEELKG